MEIQLSDTGVGMSEEVRRRIFEPFFTTKGIQGSGLGLSMAYGIMERHGGHISVASAPGQGTTFALRFQAAPSEVAATPASAPPLPSARRILLIDDDPMVRKTVAALLRAVGHVVTEADGGTAGLACLAEGRADLVLTDLGMPDMTGWDVARAVKARQPRLPVILLTGWGEAISPNREQRELVGAILSKPFRLEDLQGAIARLAG